jgi:hypothetical protein
MLLVDFKRIFCPSDEGRILLLFFVLVYFRERKLFNGLATPEYVACLLDVTVLQRLRFSLRGNNLLMG